MNRRDLIATSAAALAATALPHMAKAKTPAGASMSNAPVPPVARKIPVTIEQLGRTRVDDYQWMKDDNWQQVLRDPSIIKADVKEHLDAENAYREAMMRSTEPLQLELFEEMKGRIKEDDSSVPLPDGPWEYYTRFETGQQHPLYCRRRRQTPYADGSIAVAGSHDRRNATAIDDSNLHASTEQILLDANKLAEGKAYSSVGDTEHSRDHALFAYAEDAQGSEVYRIYVTDVATGAFVGETIESAMGGFVFSADAEWIFWINRDDNGRSDKILKRRTRGGEITTVYEEPDDGMYMGLGTSADDKFILITSGNGEQTEYRYVPADQPEATPVVIEPRREAVRYDADHWGDRWVIRTDADGAVDFKIVTAPTDAPGRAHWTDLVPFTEGRLIESISPFADYLARVERYDANTRIVIRTRAGEEHAIAVDEPAYVLGLSGTYEYDSPMTRYVYTSPSTPAQVFDYNMATRERTLRKTQEVPSGHNIDDYVVERLNAPASDGALVPVTILRRKSTPVDGSAPVLLYGYGSYGIPMGAGFNTNRLSLVDRGFIYAIAHIRGGSDKGWGWFLAARRMTKKNTFTDFIAAAEHLIEKNYATAGNIVTHGGSAGGMLMGAINNMRPDLWAGVIGDVPFVDVINTMSDVSLPLTPGEWPEWGDPITDPEAYDYMYSYSPYDQVEAKAYPAVLATGGLSDPRVTYWEPEKWVAKLRPATTSGKPVLLKINMTAGHFSSSGRFDYLKDIAVTYAFAIWAIRKGWEQA
ncbi:S9 family peptidase [Brevundimonas sp. FT23042]|uniref:S9 family peptidase n=1 Tax=Brevundimonas sp. FT23042 TaxID=3393749 RepID=UPI003B588B4A